MAINTGDMPIGRGGKGKESDRQRGRKTEMRNGKKKDDGDQKGGWGGV